MFPLALMLPNSSPDVPESTQHSQVLGLHTSAGIWQSVRLLNLSHSGRCMVVSHCGFNAFLS